MDIFASFFPPVWIKSVVPRVVPLKSLLPAQSSAPPVTEMNSFCQNSKPSPVGQLPHHQAHQHDGRLSIRGRIPESPLFAIIALDVNHINCCVLADGGTVTTPNTFVQIIIMKTTVAICSFFRFFRVRNSMRFFPKLFQCS